MASSVLESLSNEFAGMAEQIGSAVFAVHGRSRSMGSGIQWRKGVIVTASHAVGRDEVSVTTNSGQSVPAKLAGRDPSTDLAVLRIEQNAMAAVEKFAKGDDLKLANLVLALGRSWRGNLVASAGVIGGLSGQWRTPRGGRLDQHIRLALELYPGMSGGPLLNARGEVVGINTNGLDRGRPVTVPASTVNRVATELLEKGHIARPHLGLAMQPVSLPETVRNQLKTGVNSGLLTIYVEAAGPAEKAGMMLGDILLELQGRSVEDLGDVQQFLGSSKIGDSVSATVIRGGSPLTLSIVLADRQ